MSDTRKKFTVVQQTVVGATVEKNRTEKLKVNTRCAEVMKMQLDSNLITKRSYDDTIERLKKESPELVVA